MQKMSITTRVTFDDFKKISFYFYYRKLAAKLTLVLGAGLLLMSIMPYLIGVPLFGQFPILPFALGLVMTIIVPFSIIRGAKRNYSSNRIMNGDITYDFDEEGVTISGESFTSTIDWANIYAIKVTSSWVLIWQSKQVANVIPRRDISDAQIAALESLASKKQEIN